MSQKVLNSYQDVQDALDTFVANAGVNPGGAGHGVFWHNLSYNEFITKTVPGEYNENGGLIKILEVGDPDNSAIIKILKGPYDGANPQMPLPSPPYPGQTELITALYNWIKAGCPNSGSLPDEKTP